MKTAGAQRTKRDPRGQVAIVSNSCIGPRVTFIDSGAYTRNYQEALIDSLSVAAAVYANSDGNESHSFPRTVWVQKRAGQWSAA